MDNSNSLSSHVDVKYEAWANREQVIGQHIYTLWEAQDALSGVVAVERLGIKRSEEGQIWWDFYKKVSKLFQQARPKILKMKGLDDRLTDAEKSKKKKTKLNLDYEDVLKAVTKASDYLFTGEPKENPILTKEYRDTIELISILYDIMGYTAAERKVTRTGFLSDISVPTDEIEGEEMESTD